MHFLWLITLIQDRHMASYHVIHISSLTALQHASSIPPHHHHHRHHSTFIQIFSQARTLTLFSAGLMGSIISTGATFDAERRISSCTHSLCLPESFCPIRFHWWRLGRRHKWVDNVDHVQITTLSPSLTLRPVTRPFCVEGISWI